MVPQWKRWLGAAAVLLLVGAGCQGTVQPDAALDIDADVSGELQDDGQMMIDASGTTSLDAEADAAVDAALRESDEDAKDLDESSDADVIENDSAELNAYGQTYVESELR